MTVNFVHPLLLICLIISLSLVVVTLSEMSRFSRIPSYSPVPRQIAWRGPGEVQPKIGNFGSSYTLRSSRPGNAEAVIGNPHFGFVNRQETENEANEAEVEVESETEEREESELDKSFEVLRPMAFLLPFVLASIPFAIPALPIALLLTQYPEAPARSDDAEILV